MVGLEAVVPRPPSSPGFLKPLYPKGAPSALHFTPLGHLEHLFTTQGCTVSRYPLNGSSIGGRYIMEVQQAPLCQCSSGSSLKIQDALLVHLCAP